MTTARELMVDAREIVLARPLDDHDHGHDRDRDRDAPGGMAR